MPTFQATGTNKNVTVKPTGTGKVIVGTGAANATLSSSGAHNLVLETNSGTTSGTISITDGANGNIDITPDGTGIINLPKVNIDAGTIDGATITSPVINTSVSGTAILDEDNMAGNSATKLATQQSIKAYVDSAIVGPATTLAQKLGTGDSVEFAGATINGTINPLEVINTTSGSSGITNLLTLHDNSGVAGSGGGIKLTTSTDKTYGPVIAGIRGGGGAIGDIVFNTIGTASPTEAMRIDSTGDVTVSTGNLVIGTAGSGIDFGVVTDGVGTHTDEGKVLDDYEEGTWAAVVSDAASAGNLGGSYNGTGWYTKTGNKITLSFALINITIGGLTVGNTLYITGLPYGNAPTSFEQAIGSVLADSVTYTSGSLSLNIGDSSSSMTIAKSVSGALDSRVIVSNLVNGTSDIWGSITYFTS